MNRRTHQRAWAPATRQPTAPTGSAYVFGRQIDWGLLVRIPTPVPSGTLDFGRRVALSGATLAMADPGVSTPEADGGTASGGVFVYR